MAIAAMPNENATSSPGDAFVGLDDPTIVTGWYPKAKRSMERYCCQPRCRCPVHVVGVVYEENRSGMGIQNCMVYGAMGDVARCEILPILRIDQRRKMDSD